MTIRQARLSDYAIIEKIVNRVGLFDYWYLYKVLIWWGRVWVITVKDRVIGFVSYIALPMLRHTFCLQVGVDPEAQGKGIGKKLIGHLQRISAKLHQAKHVWAHTLRPRALGWFKKKMRFKEVGSAMGVYVIKSPEIEEQSDVDDNPSLQ